VLPLLFPLTLFFDGFRGFSFSSSESELASELSDCSNFLFEILLELFVFCIDEEE
jgi:hypothetical protein